MNYVRQCYAIRKLTNLLSTSSFSLSCSYWLISCPFSISSFSYSWMKFKSCVYSPLWLSAARWLPLSLCDSMVSLSLITFPVYSSILFFCFWSESLSTLPFKAKLAFPSFLTSYLSLWLPVVSLPVMPVSFTNRFPLVTLQWKIGSLPIPFMSTNVC